MIRDHKLEKHDHANDKLSRDHKSENTQRNNKFSARPALERAIIHRQLALGQWAHNEQDPIDDDDEAVGAVGHARVDEVRGPDRHQR